MNKKIYPTLLMSLPLLMTSPLLNMQMDPPIVHNVTDITHDLSTYIPADRYVEIDSAWQSISNSDTLYRAVGRPDTCTQNGLFDWPHFIAKISHENNRENKDYTIFGSTRDKPAHAPAVPLSVDQEIVLQHIRKADYAELNQILQSLRHDIFHEQLINKILELAWHQNYHIKAAAIFVLTELGKSVELPAYVYHVLSQACVEENYPYPFKPSFFTLPGCFLYWLGCPEFANHRKQQLAVETYGPELSSNPLVHHTINKTLTCLGGAGKITLRDGRICRQIDVNPSQTIAIPAGTHIHIRNTTLKRLIFWTQSQPIHNHNQRLETQLAPAIWPNKPSGGIAETQKEYAQSLVNQHRLFEIYCDLHTQSLPLLYRYFLIRLSNLDNLIDDKLAIANDREEHWFLRVAAIGALAPYRSKAITTCMKKLCHDPIRAVRRAARQGMFGVSPSLPLTVHTTKEFTCAIGN